MKPIDGNMSKTTPVVTRWLSGQSKHSSWQTFRGPQRFEGLFVKSKSRNQRTEGYYPSVRWLVCIVSKPVRDSTRKCDALESLHYNWVCHQFNQRRNINRALICAKASRIQSLLNQSSDGNVRTLSFSKGWLSNFKRRCGLRRF